VSTAREAKRDACLFAARIVEATMEEGWPEPGTWPEPDRQKIIAALRGLIADLRRRGHYVPPRPSRAVPIDQITETAPQERP
jgi:hypothetical protein